MSPLKEWPLHRMDAVQFRRPYLRCWYGTLKQVRVQPFSSHHRWPVVNLGGYRPVSAFTPSKQAALAIGVAFRPAL
ncbi:MAG: hypothetical protein JOZ08_25860 [Verrucomicrobia bacterium]|nr:hypothetical protein [Verrucomicrobiota bacterium]MBV8278355.1 hypothetical protein [Verrucomicrobiota bacterium]